MNLFNTFHFHTLQHPWVLLFSIGVVILLIAECFARAPGAVTISTGETLAGIRVDQGAIWRRLPAILRALGLIVLLVALARPLQGLAVKKDEAEIIDIMLCVDVSRSMQATDLRGSRTLGNRLDVTKEAIANFIENRKKRPDERFGLDRIGLICYAKFAWTQTPLTLDYAVLEHDVERVQLEGGDDGLATAIGSALGLAVSKLRKSEAKAKVIILLTDGRNNFGELAPFTAAEIAKDYGIRVYTIAAGRDTGFIAEPGAMAFGTRVTMDTETLERIANITEGQFFHATDYKSLESAYNEINQLETTTVEIGDYYEYREAFVPWAVLGALLIASSVATRRLWFEPVP